MIPAVEILFATHMAATFFHGMVDLVHDQSCKLMKGAATQFISVRISALIASGCRLL